MATKSAAELIDNQHQLMDEMNTLFINFKKDGKHRKTIQNVTNRLRNLDSFWNKFLTNHTLLDNCDEVEEDPYFINDEFSKTQTFYNKVKAHIQQFLSVPEIKTTSASPTSGAESEAMNQNPSDSETENKPYKPTFKFADIEEDVLSNKLEELMRRQQSNFKALNRTLSQINLNVICEKWEFQDLLKNIEARWSVIDKLHWEIDSQLITEDKGYERLFNEYENEYLSMKKLINTKMWDASNRESTTPKMDIPIFNGNYQQWISFRDLFIETIHKNKSMSNAQKMQFLKSKVRGEAEKLIQHLTISSNNYQVCWDILNHRYHNKKLIFNSHMNVLMSLSTMHHQNAAQIKKIHDTTNECLNAIKHLGIDTANWDPIIIYLVSQKLDSETHSDYIESLPAPRDLPYLSDFLTYLENKFISLETARHKHEPNRPSSSSQQPHQYPPKQAPYAQPKGKRQGDSYIKQNNHSNFFNRANENKPFINHSVTKTWNQKCVICNGNHAIFLCKKLRSASIEEQRKVVTQFNLCKNCLYNHEGKICNSTKTCRHCNEKHNSILHDAYVTTNTNRVQQTEPPTQPKKNVTNILRNENTVTETLLATAKVRVLTADGTYKTMRALIDQGSQTSLISENAAQQLKIPRKRCKGVIYGIGSKENNCKGKITINISSLINDFTIDVDAFIMNNLISKLPNQSFPKPSWPHLSNIPLADSDFNISKPIDILLGADVYSSILLHGIIKEDISRPIAQQTQFGWILCGNMMTSYHCNVIINNFEDIKRFWEIEDLSGDGGPDKLSTEDEQCLRQYQSETKRQPDGRYVVSLPLKPDVNEKLGESRSKAIAQFYQLERKFSRNEKMAKDYKDFINEYLSLGHMRPSDCNQTPSCYLPHHCVIRADSATTKTRVVINGSAKTSTGYSINDLMYSGPNLQKDLFSLIIQWRQFKIGFTSDIEKMFRQIMVHERYQGYQKIIWRDSPNQALREYQLTTASFGLKCSPFLAMMTLRQLATDEAHRFPEASKVLKNNCYMDDIIYGHHYPKSAKKLQEELISLTAAGGFNLRKWNSNEPELRDKANDKNQIFDFRHQESTKTLGLQWLSKNDNFTYQIKVTNTPEKNTKRSLLSDISKVFDPIGWLSPTTTKLKLLFQQLWKIDVSWDDELPENINKEWNQCKIDLQNLNHIQIPRWLRCHENSKIELHGYCDASTKAYACVVYCKTNQNDTNCQSTPSVTIVAAKSRLVPVKKEISLPKLELCAAVLLSKLMKIVCGCLKDYQISTFGWSDSTAVLGWINGDPCRWKPFVANRVRQITLIMPAQTWNYVQSADNPADCASRGITAAQLKCHSLWWNGPSWLPSFNSKNQMKKNLFTTDKEKCKQLQINVVMKSYENEIIESLINRHSNYTRTCRVLAWVLRALSPTNSKQSHITLSEIKKAQGILFKHVQHSEFLEDITNLKNQNKLSSKCKLLNLNPFLDNQGLMRVGGRLKNACISEDMKHPIILPHNHHLTDLIIDYHHKMNFHGGARLTLASIRRHFWIIGGNNAVKKRLRRCVLCRKHNKENQNQLMGDLPSARTNPSRPFHHTGVDFTGYVNVKTNKGRGVKCTKGYVAVFVCMVTKAVHLELVSDLTSSAFLAALRRMSARRGTPKHIHSDNGTNFVGAHNILEKQFFNLKNIIDDTFHQALIDMEIKWHFNAPSWPSAGGLWEAAVKSLKYHLKRVLGEQRLTYEEFNTLLVQLEGCLNSRPLCAISEDPDDIDFITPSHFLSSGPILTIYETETDERTRWRLTQKIYLDIWKRWHSEYLTQLNKRSKWWHSKENIKVNDVVIINDENTLAGNWILGRVLELHPGKDGLVRVVSVKTKGGIIKRPVIKLSVLPINNDCYQKPNKTGTSLNNTENSPENLEEQQPKRGRNTKSYNVVTMALMTLMLIVSPVKGIHNLSKLKDNQSLYFDQTTNMKLIRDNWNLVVYYNMDPYWLGTELVNKNIIHLDYLCEKVTKKSHCDLVLLQLRHSYNELDYYNQILLNQEIPHNYKRTRRGLINAVGNIAHSLFGVLDEEFAEKYEKDIMSLRKNQKHLALLWKNQTSIVESEFNLLQRLDNTISKQYKIFNQHENEFHSFQNKIRKEMYDTEIINEFALSSITANGIILTLKSIQETLLDTITNIFYGKFNIHLLKPSQLIDELHVISGQISKDLSLPIDNVQTDLTKLYHLLSVKTRMTNEYLIFEIKIPLVSRDNFEIYKLIPIPRPIMQGNQMSEIIPISDYLATNIHKDSYIPLSETEIQKCIHFDLDTIMCPLQKPIYHTKAYQDFCVKNKESHTCKINNIGCADTWIQLHNVNNYLYSCCDQCSTRLICGHQVTSLRLSKAGIVTMDSDCVIKSDEITLHAHQQRSNELSLKPDVLQINIPPINNFVDLALPNTPLERVSNDSFQSDLQDVKTKIKYMRTENSKIEEDIDQQLSHHDVHHYVLIYLLVGAFACACALYGARRVRAGRSRQRNSTRADAWAGAGSPAALSLSQPLPLRARTEAPLKPPRVQSSISSISGQCVSDDATPSASEQINKVSKPVFREFSVVD